MPELHLRQSGFLLTVIMNRLLNIVKVFKNKKTGDLNYIYKNELDKACFARHATYSDSKNLAKRTISDTIMKDKSYEIAINAKSEGHQRGLVK